MSKKEMTIPTAVEVWMSFSSTVAAIMFGWAMFQRYCPHQLKNYLVKYVRRLLPFLYPNIHIKFHEFTADNFRSRSDVYTTIQAYLSTKSSSHARNLKADAGGGDTRNLVLSMDDYERVTDDFQGIKFSWYASVSFSNTSRYSFYPARNDKRYYILTFHKRYRDLVITSYLNHVMERGKALKKSNRQRKLYTNNKNDNPYRFSNSSMWSHVLFEHPSTFETLAMDPDKKKEIIDDLFNFRNSKGYYKKIGKAWKRGYLLYGPPGTGKSSMIAAMANLLEYDVYDLELTAVKDNTELRKLLIETSSKSIIVIEDIDCSLDLTGQRENKKDEEEKEKNKKKDKDKDKDNEKEEKAAAKKKAEEKRNKDKESKVTLSGLLNFIDGLWSACAGERLIVFTTNYMEKLDPALIRRGRMDKHVEMSYCKYEGFKVLAKNYLDLDAHPLFEEIRELINETQITPADVAEHLMPKSLGENDEAECLEVLIRALQGAKEEARMKAEEALAEAARVKADEELRTTNEAAAQEKESLTRSDDKEAESIRLEETDPV